MKLINKIHIRFFRSIYNIEFDNISETITVFTGNNDVGKSNVLRALNLFFNDETETDEEISFERDFSLIRKKELKEKIKTRQLIKIDVEIQSPIEYKILPKTFLVSKNFDRYNESSDFYFSKNIDNKKNSGCSSTIKLNTVYLYSCDQR